MWTVVWVGVVITTLLFFTLKMTYKIGYKRGGRMVLEQWKDEVRRMENEIN